MAEFLNLGGERAGAALMPTQTGDPADPAPGRLQEARPVGGRITPGEAVIEQMLVFDE